MTDREALNALNKVCEVYKSKTAGVINRVLINETFLPVVKKAISALTERMEREGGCEYCERALSITSGFLADSHISKIHGLSGIVTYALCINGSEYQRINFCPMCGRKLSGTDTNAPTNGERGGWVD